MENKSGSVLSGSTPRVLEHKPIKESESRLVASDSLLSHGLRSPWNSPGQNTGVGSLSLLQGIFSTQGLNPGLLHCRWILYQPSHKGSLRILEWVAYPFSGSSWSRNWARVSCIAGGFLTNWAMKEAFERLGPDLIFKVGWSLPICLLGVVPVGTMLQHDY